MISQPRFLGRLRNKLISLFRDWAFGPLGEKRGGPDTLERLAGSSCPHACIQVSLEGARRAVAWSGINAFNGCGFDLVWASGRTWALLCEDALSRNLWVRQTFSKYDELFFFERERTRLPLFSNGFEEMPSGDRGRASMAKVLGHAERGYGR